MEDAAGVAVSWLSLLRDRLVFLPMLASLFLLLAIVCMPEEMEVLIICGSSAFALGDR